MLQQYVTCHAADNLKLTTQHIQDIHQPDKQLLTMISASTGFLIILSCPGQLISLTFKETISLVLPDLFYLSFTNEIYK